MKKRTEGIEVDKVEKKGSVEVGFKKKGKSDSNIRKDEFRFDYKCISNSIFRKAAKKSIKAWCSFC